MNNVKLIFILCMTFNGLWVCGAPLNSLSIYNIKNARPLPSGNWGEYRNDLTLDYDIDVRSEEYNIKSNTYCVGYGFRNVSVVTLVSKVDIAKWEFHDKTCVACRYEWNKFSVKVKTHEEGHVKTYENWKSSRSAYWIGHTQSQNYTQKFSDRAYEHFIRSDLKSQRAAIVKEMKEELLNRQELYHKRVGRTADPVLPNDCKCP